MLSLQAAAASLLKRTILETPPKEESANRDKQLLQLALNVYLCVICWPKNLILYYIVAQIYFLLRINAPANWFDHTLTNQQAERINSIFL